MREISRYIIPFFIPHLGCPNQCVFCNQHHVSGQTDYPKTKDIMAAIEKWEGPALPEIAFYGGSFTGLSFKLQEYFLTPARQALEAGKIRGIRVSTRPDYINQNVLTFLKSFGVTTVELGIQSLDPEVLQNSCRGHSAEDAMLAVKMVKERGFMAGVQLMPGLPGDTWEKTLRGTFILARLKPDLARIYPTLVLKDTPLHKLFLEGKYYPLDLESAIHICRDMQAVFRCYGVNVIRTGLQPTKDIALGAQVAAGPFHPAFGELVASALLREQIVLALENFLDRHPTGRVKLFVSYRDCSMAAGHRRSNINFLQQQFGLKQISIAGSQKIPRGTVGVASEGQNQPLLVVQEEEFIKKYVEQTAANLEV